MRAEEHKKTCGVYCTVPFSLWTPSRVEKIKQKARFASFVSCLLQRGKWRREQGGGVEERDKKMQNRPHRPGTPFPRCPHPGNFIMLRMSAGVREGDT